MCNNPEYSVTSNNTHSHQSKSSTQQSSSCTTRSNLSEVHASEVQGLPEEQKYTNEQSHTSGAASGTSNDQQDSDTDGKKDLIAPCSAGDDVSCPPDSCGSFGLTIK